MEHLTYIFKTAKLVVEISESHNEPMGTDKGIPSLGNAEVHLEHVIVYQGNIHVGAVITVQRQ